MMDAQHAKQLEVLGQIPKMLNKAAFSKEQTLWVKQKTHPSLDGVQLSKKYEFTKKGKTFGIETTRFLCLYQGHLFYFNEAQSNQFLGFCSLQNVYIQWFQLKNNNFLLFISNGNQTSEFYFDQPTFWKQQRKEIAKFTVMLNFYQQFEVLDQLGQGSFAKVFRVRDYDTKIEYAAKIINKKESNPSMIEMLAEQKRLLSYLQESHYICQFKEFHQTNEEHIILIEYVTGVDLMSFVRMKLDPSISDIKYLLTNILMGIKDCHDNQIIHRDIKPQNIIIDVHTFQIKIIDFGLSLHLSSKNSQCNLKKCGTIGYMAPEVFQCKKKGYNYKCDIFSFGIVAHLLLLGSNPLKGKTYEQTCLKNQACKIQLNQLQIVENYGENGLHFFKRLLCVSSQERYTAQQALMNPFLRDLSGKSSVTTDDDKMRGSFD